MPSSGSDFVTAPEMTPLFGQALAVQVAEALRRHRHRRGLGVRRRLRRAGAATAAGAGRRACGATPSSTSRAACASASRRRWPAFAAKVRVGQRAAGSACAAWWSATRCSTRCRSSCWCARRALARARRGAAGGGRAWPGQTGHRPAPAGRGRGRARLPDRDPSAGRGLRAHAGRPPGAGRGLLHRLRLSAKPSTTIRSATWAR